MATQPIPAGQLRDVARRAPVRPFTRQEFERAGEQGLFRPNERLELVGGEVIRKMSPQSGAHAAAVTRLEQALRRAFAEGHVVRVQMPLALGVHSEPEPDVAVVAGCVADFDHDHPSAARLVVEVADSTARFDRRVKGSLYALAGVAEYWLLDLPERVLEVYREPVAMAGETFKHHYRSLSRLVEGDSVTPLAAPRAVLAVAEVLPRPRPARG